MCNQQVSNGVSTLEHCAGSPLRPRAFAREELDSVDAFPSRNSTAAVHTLPSGTGGPLLDASAAAAFATADVSLKPCSFQLLEPSPDYDYSLPPAYTNVNVPYVRQQASAVL